MRHPVVRIGPRGGLIVHEGKRPEYERRDKYAFSSPRQHPSDVLDYARSEAYRHSWSDNVEHGYLLDADGQIVLSRRGTANAVHFTLAELQSWRDKGYTFVHSHTNDTSFSRDDFVSSFTARLKSLEAIARSKDYTKLRIYRLTFNYDALTEQGAQAMRDPSVAGKVFDDCEQIAVVVWMRSGVRVGTDEERDAILTHATAQLTAVSLGVKYEIVHGKSPLGEK